jgi:hypothetical protein
MGCHGQILPNSWILAIPAKVRDRHLKNSSATKTPGKKPFFKRIFSARASFRLNPAIFLAGGMLESPPFNPGIFPPNRYLQYM